MRYYLYRETALHAGLQAAGVTDATRPREAVQNMAPMCDERELIDRPEGCLYYVMEWPRVGGAVRQPTLWVFRVRLREPDPPPSPYVIEAL